MAREAWKYLKETELNTVSCSQELLRKFCCLKKDCFFFPKTETISLASGFYYATNLPYAEEMHIVLA